MIVGHQRAIGGAGRGSGMVQVETECQVDVQYGLLEMWVCGGSRSRTKRRTDKDIGRGS